MSKQQQQSQWSGGQPSVTSSSDNVYELLPELRPRGSLRNRSGRTSAKVTVPPPLPPPRATLPTRKKYPRPAEVTLPDSAAIRSQLEHSASQVDLSNSLPMQLSDIITKYPHFLPLRVRVHNGYYGNASELFVAQNEIFDVHFIKRAKVVVLKYDRGQKELSVPLNSTVEFAVLYDPNHNDAEAKEGIVFNTVAELIASKPLPLVVKATRAYKGSSPESSVEAGELLLLTGVKTSSLPGRGKQLQARSLTTGGGEKQLHQKCAGAFSTKPRHVRMTLAEMIHHEFPFPQTVMTFPDSDLDSLLPATIASSPVTLEGYKEESSIVATQVDSTATSHVDLPILDIHSSVEIEVEPVQLNQSEQSQLVERTLSLYMDFDVSKVQVYVKKSNNRVYEAQALLYKRTAKNRTDGIHFEWPISLVGNLSGSSESDLSGSTPTTPSLKAHTSPIAHPVVPPIAPPVGPREYELVARTTHAEDGEEVYQEIDPQDINKDTSYTVPSTATKSPQASPSQLPVPPVAALASSSPTTEAMDLETSMAEDRVKEELKEMGCQITELSIKLEGSVQKLQLSHQETSGAIAELTKTCCQLQERLQRLESSTESKPTARSQPGKPSLSLPKNHVLHESNLHTLQTQQKRTGNFLSH